MGNAATTERAEQVNAARRAFADRNPESRRHHERARRVLPGGHTRTVLSHPPFPLTFVAASEATLIDADGHTYIDMLGDYTAGLLGHGDTRVLDGVQQAMRVLASVGGVHPHEVALAELMCARFDLDRVRFTNSGTEANLMAITTARRATGRSAILVFDGGYHGGVLSFAGGAAVSNAPYEAIVAPYNDAEETVRLIEAHGAQLAAVLVEPMLGSGGCIPAEAEFLRRTCAAARAAGTLCIADEVMTSRHGPAGLAAILGMRADITTFGKYIGGGFSFGAFGGDAELLDQFDTSLPGAINHAGTFNNNVASMAAGTIVLGEIFTADVAVVHTSRGDEFRRDIESVLSRHPLPLSVTGYGSMMSLHARATGPGNYSQAADRDAALQELIFLGLYARGVYMAPRGMINLSLVVTDDQLAATLDALDDTLASLAG